MVDWSLREDHVVPCMKAQRVAGSETFPPPAGRCGSLPGIANTMGKGPRSRTRDIDVLWPKPVGGLWRTGVAQAGPKPLHHKGTSFPHAVRGAYPFVAEATCWWRPRWHCRTSTTLAGWEQRYLRPTPGTGAMVPPQVRWLHLLHRRGPLVCNWPLPRLPPCAATCTCFGPEDAMEESKDGQMRRGMSRGGCDD